ncbi:MAG: glycosyltransferase family 4 protein [bacterium]
MKVLHLFSDWKWTGPAEPVVNLCSELKTMGIEILLACRKPPLDYPVSVEGKAKERKLNVTTRFHLNRYLDPLETLQDFCFLPSFLKRESFDIIHSHLSHDHVLGAWASRRCGIPIVRTNHKARPLHPSLWNKWLLGKGTQGLVEFSKKAMEENVRNFALDPKNCLLVEGAVDLKRFDPGLVSKDIRAALGVGPQEVLVGIVARMQRHRRFHLLLDAMVILTQKNLPVKLLVLGRGTHIREVAMEPARRMGLENRVLFPGYRGEDYVDYLAAIDLKVFLVPGSDGTCRAIREAMAMGKPIVSTRRGMLEELVEDGVTGILVEEEPQSLAAAMEKMILAPELRKSMGDAARNRALRDFSITEQAVKVAEFYRKISASAVRGKLCQSKRTNS